MPTTSRTLYRAVSQDELDQIERTSRFAVVGGGAEGKYFWEKRYDAEWFATKYGLASVVRARYHVDAIRHFYRWERLDGRGAARFAGEEEMNSGLLMINRVR